MERGGGERKARASPCVSKCTFGGLVGYCLSLTNKITTPRSVSNRSFLVPATETNKKPAVNERSRRLQKRQHGDGDGDGDVPSGAYLHKPTGPANRGSRCPRNRTYMTTPWLTNSAKNTTRADSVSKTRFEVPSARPPLPPAAPRCLFSVLAHLLRAAVAVHHQGRRRVEPGAAVHEGPVQLRGQVGVDRLPVQHVVWRPSDDPALPASEALLRDRHLIELN